MLPLKFPKVVAFMCCCVTMCSSGTAIHALVTVTRTWVVPSSSRGPTHPCNRPIKTVPRNELQEKDIRMIRNSIRRWLGIGVAGVQGMVGWGSRCGGVWGLGVIGGVSRCLSIDWLPKLWLLHFNILCNFVPNVLKSARNFM